MKHTFATAINCMDGRVQQPVIDFMKERFSVDYVDIITEAGPDKVLSENRQEDIIESIKNRVSISVEKHKSEIIVIAGHYDCAGNPVDDETHRKQIEKSVENIIKWDLNVEAYGIWVDKDWRVSLISS